MKTFKILSKVSSIISIENGISVITLDRPITAILPTNENRTSDIYNITTIDAFDFDEGDFVVVENKVHLQGEICEDDNDSLYDTNTNNITITPLDCSQRESMTLYSDYINFIENNY